CQECPVVKPTFLCGNDNRTYSSPCRLEYHNCIHHTSVHIACKGFCPCKVADLRMYSKKTQMQRKKMLMGKMGRNHDITLTPRDFNYDNHHYQYLKYTKRGKEEPCDFPEFFTHRCPCAALLLRDGNFTGIRPFDE
ncbi:Testican-3, partial [Acromyrmex echinatior]